MGWLYCVMLVNDLGGMLVGPGWLAGRGDLVCQPYLRMTWWKPPGKLCTWLGSATQVARRDEQAQNTTAIVFALSLHFLFNTIYFTWLIH